MNHDVFDRAVACLRAMDGEAYAALFAPDAVLEFPFAPASWPRRLEGREAIGAVVGANLRRAREAGRRIDRIDVRAMHDTVDPEVLVVELETQLALDSGERLPGAQYVHVYRIRGGQIVSLRDYFSSERLAEVQRLGVSR